MIVSVANSTAISSLSATGFPIQAHPALGSQKFSIHSRQQFFHFRLIQLQRHSLKWYTNSNSADFQYPLLTYPQQINRLHFTAMGIPGGAIFSAVRKAHDPPPSTATKMITFSLSEPPGSWHSSPAAFPAGRYWPHSGGSRDPPDTHLTVPRTVIAPFGPVRMTVNGPAVRYWPYSGGSGSAGHPFNGPADRYRAVRPCPDDR